MESSTGVFFKNMFSQGSCCVIEIDLSAFSLVSMEGICPCEEKKSSSLFTCYQAGMVAFHYFYFNAYCADYRHNYPVGCIKRSVEPQIKRSALDMYDLTGNNSHSQTAQQTVIQGRETRRPCTIAYYSH